MEWPIELDTNGYGHIIIDQDRELDIRVGPDRVFLTQAQVQQVLAFARKVDAAREGT